ncbi:MAG: endonuclease MutS2 [Candidatus Acetothermia bacterium]
MSQSDITNQRTLGDLEFDKLKSILKDRAASPLGRAGVEELQPSQDVSRIESSLQVVKECKTLLRRKNPLSLGEMEDLHPLFEKAREHPPLTPEELLSIASTLESGAGAKEYILELEEDFPRLRRIITEISPQSELRQKIRSQIDRRGEIRDRATPELYRLLSKKRESEEKVKEILNDFLSRNRNVVQDSVIARRSNRLVIPIKSSARNQIQCVVHESSNSGKTLFAEPSSAVELNNEIRDLASEIRDEKNKILRELTASFQAEEKRIKRTQAALKKLDSAYARARYALDYKCHNPKIMEEGEIELFDARHPLLDQEEVVPISLSFGSSNQGAVITGPNTGGKTVTLKTIGLFGLMIQSGIPIPASIDSKFSVFDGIYSDIGDEQSIEQSLSTFSSHMNNIVDILASIDSDSLVLLDELGAGTDPQEGAALGLGLVEYLLKRGAQFAVTTHFTALKHFSFNHPQLKTLSVDFDPEELVPTYHILEGVPGRSNAFIIARRLGVPDEVIEEATNFLEEGEIQAEDIIEQLANEKRKVEQRSQKMKSELQEAKQLREEYEQKLSEIRGSKQAALNEELVELEKFIKQAKKEIEQEIADAKEGDLEKARENRQAISELEETADGYRSSIEEEQRPSTSLEKGNLEIDQRVWVKSAQNHGKIAKINDGKQIVVQIKNKKIETSLGDLEPPKNSAPSGSRQGSATYHSSTPGDQDLKMELNLRGMRVREALREVDRYLDRLIRADRKKGRILHGKGTGTLRKAVRTHLQNQPLVDRCYSPPRAEGGQGVTVFELN